MDKVRQIDIRGFKIINIIKVVLDDILLELHFNLKNKTKKISFKLCISDDGETILFSSMKGWNNIYIEYETYSTFIIKNSTSEEKLSILINNTIDDVSFGVGRTLDKGESVVYYFKIETDKNRFLFFNNGDNGAYFFDNFNEILEGDIYGYRWVDTLDME